MAVEKNTTLKVNDETKNKKIRKYIFLLYCYYIEILEDLELFDLRYIIMIT